MKNLILTLIIPLCILLTSVSCKKSNALKYGGFSCKVNGQLWEPYSDDFKLQPTECTFTQSGTSLFIKANNSKIREHFAILISTPGEKVTERKYLLNSDKYLIGSYDNPSGDFITGSGYEGEIEIIKIDRGIKKITAKFHFNCRNPNNNETKDITEGEFNIGYSEY